MKIITSILIALLTTMLQLAQAQTTTEPKYLMKLGKREIITSKILGEKRWVWVQMPSNPSYISSKGAYPVMYVLDGEYQTHLTTAVIRELARGFMPDMIVVGISNSSHRMRDLSTTTIIEPNGSVIAGTGGAEKFTQFMKKELIPYIESKYPTKPYRTLVGHSLGGLVAINTLLNHPEMFNSYLAIDPSLWSDPKLVKKARREFARQSKKYKGKSLFIASANSLGKPGLKLDTAKVLKDTSRRSVNVRAIIEIAEALKKNKEVSSDWAYYKNENHGSIPLLAMYNGFRSIFNWFQPKPANMDKIWGKTTPVKEILQTFNKRYDRLSHHLGYKIVPQEKTINEYGYGFLQFRPKLAYTFFKMNIKHYPKSANVYDSMADYHLLINDVAKALKCVTKAYEISGNNYHKGRVEQLKDKQAKIKGKK